MRRTAVTVVLSKLIGRVKAAMPAGDSLVSRSIVSWGFSSLPALWMPSISALGRRFAPANPEAEAAAAVVLPCACVVLTVLTLRLGAPAHADVPPAAEPGSFVTPIFSAMYSALGEPVAGCAPASRYDSNVRV